MAYGNKYHTTWYNWYNQYNEVWILQKGFGGTVETVQSMEPPAELEMNEPSDDPFAQAIHGSVVKLLLQDSTGFKYLPLMIASDKEYLVRWERGGVLWWCGWVAPGEFQHPYSLAPYGVEIMCTDGLATLKNYDFSETHLTGKQNLLDVLINCLIFISQSGHDPQYVYENVNKYEYYHLKTATDSPLTQTYVDCEDLFYDEDGVSDTCYEAINKVLGPWGVILKQAWGQWHVLQIGISNDSYNRRKYNIAGGGFVLNETYSPVIETTRMGVKSTMNVVKVEGMISSLPSWKKLIVTQNYNKRDNILIDGTLDEWMSGYNFNGLADWPASGSLAYSQQEKGIRFVGDYITSTTNHYISQSINYGVVGSSVGQRLKLSVKYRTYSDSGVSKWGWSLSTKVGSNYHYYSTEDGWSSAYPVLIVHINEVNVVMGDSSGEYSHDTTEDMPSGGAATATLRIHADWGPHVEDLYLEEINLQMFEYAFDYPEEYEYEAILNPDNNNVEEYQLNLGDAPLRNINNFATQIPHAEHVCKNILYYKSGAYYYPTGRWDYGSAASGTGYQQLIQKLITEASSLRKDPRLIIGGEVYSAALNPLSVLKEGSNTSLKAKRFRVGQGSYDGLTGCWVVEMAEIPVYEVLSTKAGKVITTKDGKTIVVH